ncbi:MAG: hypothetical protein HY303_20185, partial [Candidatus Wallbacteria bacterium]|nr:hypothetical protein [Candidatus Wallbacteria bacterium]
MSVGAKLGLALAAIYAVALASVVAAVLSGHERALARRCKDQRQAMLSVFASVTGRPVLPEEEEALGKMMSVQEQEWRKAGFRVRLAIVGVGVLSALVGLVGALLLARLVTAPVTRLRDDMLALARGGLPPLPAPCRPPSFEIISCEKEAAAEPPRAPGAFLEGLLAQRGDELYQLRQGFQLMVHELQQRMAQLETTTKEREVSKRLGDIGALAGTVAHEMRNPLNTIEGAVYHLKQTYREHADIVEYAGLIEEQVTRLVSVSAHLLDATRPLAPALQPTDLNLLIRDTVLRLVREGDARKVQVEFRLSPELPSIHVDPIQMKQVVENLVENSLQAMPEGGRVTVDTAVDEAGDVLLRIADDGPGIRMELRERVFEPFFTTRTTGTGLGLYIV